MPHPPPSPPTETPSSSPSPGPPARRGCLFWGGMALIVTILSVGGCIFWAYWRVRHQLLRFSEEGPAPSDLFVTREGSEIADVRSRLFGTESEPAPPRVTLDGDDLQALVRDAMPEDAEEEGRLAVDVVAGRIRLDVSWSLDAIPGLSGRYLNARMRVAVGYEHGELSVHVEEATTPDGSRRMSRYLLRLFSQRIGAAIHRTWDGLLNEIATVTVRGDLVIVER